MKKLFKNILLISTILLLLGGCRPSDCLPNGTLCDGASCDKKCCSEESHFGPSDSTNWDGPAIRVCGPE